MRETVQAGPLRLPVPAASVTPAAQVPWPVLPARSTPIRRYLVCGLPPLMCTASTIRASPPEDLAEKTVTPPFRAPYEGSATRSEERRVGKEGTSRESA